MAKRPNPNTFDQLPVYGAPAPDRVYALEATLQNLEQGIFYDAAYLVDSMLRDDRIRSCMATRALGVLSAELDLKAARDTAKGRAIAEECEDQWDDMFPDAELTELITWGEMLGFGLAQNVWTKTVDGWSPTLKVWRPHFVTYRADTQSYWVTVKNNADGVGRTTNQIEIVPGEGDWIVYAPYGYQHGWLRGHLRSLAHLWIKRAWAFRDWARYSEVHGMPIKLAYVPQDASDAEKQRFFAGLVNMANEAVIRLPKSEQDGFDLKLLEAQAQGHEGFRTLLDKLETSIAVDLLGQNLTTEVKGGSFAAAKVSDNVRCDIAKAQAKGLQQTLRRQTLKPWAFFNFSDPELAPFIEWQVTPPDDTAKKASELLTLAQAINMFRQCGAPVNVRAILEEHNVPLHSENDVPDPILVDAMGFAEEEDAAPLPEAPPGLPDTSKPVEGDDSNTSPVMKPQKLSALPERKSRPRKAAFRGQYYADALADSARQRARDAIKPDLAEVKRIVETSSTPKELKARLLARYRHMDPARLQTVMERATSMANLAGRLAVVEDL